jgi:hypothetical protein
MKSIVFFFKNALAYDNADVEAVNLKVLGANPTILNIAYHVLENICFRTYKML